LILKLNIFHLYDFLPTIGFQLLENIETQTCKRIGDPNGFCGAWCIWWVYQRMNNLNISNDLSSYLINTIKSDNISFKNIIRNFSGKITDIRDKTLKKYNLDINDWISGNYNDMILDNIEKDVLKLLNKIK
jgi:hypothetical protein